MKGERNRKRYILFDIISNKEIIPASLEKTVLNTISRNFGELGVTESKILLLKELYKKNHGIFVTTNNFVAKLKFVFGLIKKIDDNEVIITTKKVYGTLKKFKRGGS